MNLLAPSHHVSWANSASIGRFESSVNSSPIHAVSVKFSKKKERYIRLKGAEASDSEERLSLRELARNLFLKQIATSSERENSDAKNLDHESCDEISYLTFLPLTGLVSCSFLSKIKMHRNEEVLSQYTFSNRSYRCNEVCYVCSKWIRRKHAQSLTAFTRFSLSAIDIDEVSDSFKISERGANASSEDEGAEL